MADKVLLSRREAAQLLSLSVRTIDHLIKSKEIVVRRVGRRRLIPAIEVERFTRRDHPGRG
jgi:excisionase family DNA binding protein